MIVSSELEKIGLSSNEAKVYIALLENKISPVSVIAKKAHIHRVTCYDVLEYLHKKELAVKIKKNGKIYFSANNPKYLKQWIKERQKKIDRQNELLKTIIPQLEFVYSDNAQKPTVLYFEGINGIKELLEDVIYTKPDMLCAYVSPKIFEGFFSKSYVRKYTKAKSKLNIRHRLFTPKESLKPTIDYLNTYYAQILHSMEIKVIDYSHTATTSEISLYENKMSIVNYSDKKHSGVIIENKDLYDIQMAIFNSLWKKTKKIETLK